MSRYSTRLLPVLLSGLLSFFSSCQQHTREEENLPSLRTLSAAEEQLTAAGNEFSFDIFNRINQQHTADNIFISPFSISAALSMTANGAKGETKDGIKQALALQHLQDEEMNEAYRDLSAFLLGLDKKVSLQIANSNWHRQEHQIKAAFKDILLQYYGAEVKPADFTDPATKDRINDWIEEKTNGKISNMLDEIPANAMMYLINTIYFKADWQYKFDETKTEKAPFFAKSGEVQTDMMYSPGTKVSYAYQPDFTLVDIPYGNGQFSMTVLVENGNKDINEVIRQLNASEFSSLLANADTITAELYLPRFKMAFKKTLNSVLTDMGMGTAFGNGAVDFSGLFEEPLSLYISRVLHQSFIEVNEEGSEAAAATIVEMVLTSAGGGETRSFHINRPFAFFIREKHSNAILFAGKVLNPAGE